MNKLVIVLVLTTAAASFACMHLVNELREERAHSDALQTRITELERSAAERTQAASVAVAQQTSPFSPFTGSVAEGEPAPSTTASIPTASESRSSVEPPDLRAQMKERFARQRELMKDPKYLEAMRKQQRTHMEARYPGLEEALGLSAAEYSRFLDVLSQQQVEEMAKASETMIWDPSDPDAMKKAQDAIAQRQQRYQQEIDAQFGPGVREKWTEYQQTVGQRYRVAAMQSQLALAGAPLNAEQSKAVLNALVEEQQRQMDGQINGNANTGSVQLGFRPFPTADGTDWLQKQERSHERVLSALQSSLTSQQLDQLEQIFAREREMQRASMELMRAQGVEGGNTIYATGGFAPAAGLSWSVSPIEVREAEETSEE